MEWNGTVLSVEKYDDNNDDTHYSYSMVSADIAVKFT